MCLYTYTICICTLFVCVCAPTHLLTSAIDLQPMQLNSAGGPPMRPMEPGRSRPWTAHLYIYIYI